MLKIEILRKMKYSNKALKAFFCEKIRKISKKSGLIKRFAKKIVFDYNLVTHV